jgi:translation initiation factor IF-3
VISDTGEQLGIMTLKDAMKLAHEKQLDLVEIAPGANPPVCRIMDYGKYRYEQSKRDKTIRKKQKVVKVKEVTLSVKIGEHDLNVRVRNAESFLKDGDKVKATIRFRGREIVHNDLGRTLLLDFADKLKDIAVIEQQPRMEGRTMVMVLAPKAQRSEE